MASAVDSTNLRVDRHRIRAARGWAAVSCPARSAALWLGLGATACGASGPEVPIVDTWLGLEAGAASPFASQLSPRVHVVSEPGGLLTKGSVRVAVIAPGMVTPGGKAVRATVSETPAGEFWLEVPVFTGVGDGAAAILWSPRSGRARLPLGGRAGELELRLVPSTPSSEVEVAQAVAAVGTEAEVWSTGSMRLVDHEDTLVGAIQLSGPDHPAQIGVWDPTWRTQGMVAADRIDEGGDLLLAFPVEPSLEGEPGLLRVNVVTRRVIVPSGPQPSPDDRHLWARPGVVSEAERAEGEAWADQQARAAELSWMFEVAPRLTTAVTDGARCRPIDELDPAWGLVLAGYATESVREDNVCNVIIEPAPPQHRRRFRGRLTPSGPVPAGE